MPITFKQLITEYIGHPQYADGPFWIIPSIAAKTGMPTEKLDEWFRWRQAWVDTNPAGTVDTMIASRYMAYPAENTDAPPPPVPDESVEAVLTSIHARLDNLLARVPSAASLQPFLISLKSIDAKLGVLLSR